MYREQLENIHTDVGCQGQTIDDSVMEQGGGGGREEKTLSSVSRSDRFWF